MSEDLTSFGERICAEIDLLGRNAELNPPRLRYLSHVLIYIWSRNADSACPFCHRANTKTGTLSQHFVTHVVPPLGVEPLLKKECTFSTSGKCLFFVHYGMLNS